MGLWDSAFASGMPGVVSATLTPSRGAESTAYVQWWRDLQIAAEGDYRTAAVYCKIQGTDASLSGMHRGDLVTVAGTEYQAVTDAESDGHGVSTLYLEPAP